MSVLDNPAWNALNTFHAHLAMGGDVARRYPDHIAPIAAVVRCDQQALDEVASLFSEHDWISLPATLDGLGLLVRPPLKIRFARMLVQMVCDRPVHVPPNGAHMSVLSERDVAEMMALTAL